MMGGSLLSLICIFVSCLTLGYAIDEYNLFFYCDKKISLINKGIHDVLVYYDHEFRMFSDFDCTIEIWGYLEGNRLALQFPSYNLTGTNTAVEVRQGILWDTSKPIAGLPEELTSSTSNVTDDIYLTDRQDIFIRLSGEPPPIGVRIFDLVINHFHTGECYSYEKPCLNGRCIDKSIKCNGYNPCGDYSDCNDDDEPMTQGMLLLICIVSVFGAFFIFGILYAGIKYKWTKYRQDRRQARAEMALDADRAETILFDPHENINRADDIANGTSESPRNLTEGASSQRECDYTEGEIGVDAANGPPTYSDVTSSQVKGNIPNDLTTPPPDYNTAVYGSSSKLETNI